MAEPIDALAALSDEDGIIRAWPVPPPAEFVPNRDEPAPFYASVLLGAATAAVTETLLSPARRAASLMREEGELLRNGQIRRRFGNWRASLVTIGRKKGPQHMWEGNVRAITRAAPTLALNFLIKDAMRAALLPTSHEDILAAGSYWYAGNVASGVAAGVGALAVTYGMPADRISMAHLSGKNLPQRYKGFARAAVGAGVYRGIMFGAFDSLKPILFPTDVGAEPASSFLLGLGTTFVAGSIVYPWETIAKDMMIMESKGNPYRSVLECGSKLVRSEGLTALYRGCWSLCRRSVWGATALTVYDQLKFLCFDEEPDYSPDLAPFVAAVEEAARRKYERCRNAR